MLCVMMRGCFEFGGNVVDVIFVYDFVEYLVGVFVYFIFGIGSIEYDMYVGFVSNGCYLRYSEGGFFDYDLGGILVSVDYLFDFFEVVVFYGFGGFGLVERICIMNCFIIE